MSQAFTRHHQIVCAILENKGDNSYLTTKGGLSYGVRKQFVNDVEGEGVVPITLAPQAEAETVQGALLKKMKYDAPKLCDLPEKVKLSQEMSSYMMEHMDINMMDNELIDAWAEEIAGNDN